MSDHIKDVAALLVTAACMLILTWLAAQAIIDWGTVA